MILSKDINPERDIYFLGAKLIEVLLTFDIDKVDYFDAYRTMKTNYGLSINLFSLVLDWLYLLGVVKTDKRYIIKCF